MKLDIFFLSFLFFLKFAKCGELYFPKIAEAIFPGPAFLLYYSPIKKSLLPFPLKFGRPL